VLIEKEPSIFWGVSGEPYSRQVRIASASRTFDLHLRRLETLAEYRQCELLQARIWGPDDVGCVSPLVMITAQENGGMAIGAFVGEQLVGFVCSFLGMTEDGGLKQCSVLMAVDPELRNSNLGFHLKAVQREVALAQGIKLITWTFDPLASPNAKLNVHKLGCVASRYLPNCYGTFSGGLNAGMPTDRFLVEWWLRERRVEECLNGTPPATPAEAEPVNEVAPHPGSGLPHIRRFDLGRGAPALLVEVPPDIQAIKRVDLEVARAWTDCFREIFPCYFGRGYQVTGFVPLPGEHRGRCGYVLSRVEGGRVQA
jgi:predicted GNAT superfamily acetyltransferase